MRIAAMLLCVAMVLGGAGPAQASVAGEAIDDDVLYLFWGDGCPHCASEKSFLVELEADHPELEVQAYEVWEDPIGRARFIEVMAALGEEPRAVPTTLFGGRLWVGFDGSVADEIRAVVASRFEVDQPIQGPPVTGRIVELPLVGSVALDEVGLFPATLAIALVDGFNPCSLWALSILLALVLRSGSRRRVLAVGGVFLVVTTILYGLYIGGMYGALSFAAEASWIRIGMAVVALGFGIVNLKDFLWFKRGLSLTIPERAKPALYARMRSVADAERPLPGVLAGTAGLAVGVSLLETPCTAGYPLLWSNMLADSGVGLATAGSLFAVYMAVFLVDELAIFGTAVVAMRAVKLQERGGRFLKLIGGSLMVSLAVALIAFPEAMTSFGGAMAVFAAGAGVAGAVVLMSRIGRVRRDSLPKSTASAGRR